MIRFGQSRESGRKPVRRRIRDLAWVVTRWAKVARPRVIMLENVEEFREWGPINERGKPIIDKAGATFRRWINEFERLGYQVDWRELVASDYGAPTKRKRLFVVARRDGAPIRWPEPTHGLGGAPVRCAADIVDWSVPCPSIFERRRPLAAATMRRAALGVERFVTSPPSPHLAPWPERLADGATAPVAAFMAQHNTGLVGHAMDRPVSTIVQRGSTQALVTCLLARADGALSGGPRSPSHAESVRALLRSEGCGVPEVHLRGELHVVADVRMRMLTPRELFMAQGFNSDYVIDGLFNGRGRPITKGEQAALCGNSVCPPVAEALVHSQFATARSGPYSEAA